MLNQSDPHTQASPLTAAPPISDTLNGTATTLNQALAMTESILGRVRGSVPLLVDGQKGGGGGGGEQPNLISLANLTQKQASQLIDQLGEILARL